jgi:hypothetical protein
VHSGRHKRESIMRERFWSTWIYVGEDAVRGIAFTSLESTGYRLFVRKSNRKEKEYLG